MKSLESHTAHPSSSINQIENTNTLTESEIDFLEQQIPDMAAAGGKAAYWEALSAGLSVTCAEGDELWEIFPDGSRRFIKNLSPDLNFPAGTTFKIR